MQLCECEAQRKTGTVIGIDLGYTEMMATSEQELLGTDSGTVLLRYFGQTTKKQRAEIAVLALS
ncbi:MAG: hypothetical protein ACLVAP_07905 [Parasutterella sp.]